MPPNTQKIAMDQSFITDDMRGQLELYEAALRKWQKSINLVSPSTLQEARMRHFDDSVQLARYIPKTCKTLYDIGSGAGFPGMVLAILRPDIDVSLVESDTKKCSFLRHVSRETNVKVNVINERIEAVFTSDLAIDVVTARALASLEDLFSYCLPLLEANQDLKMIFMKGMQAADEIQHAQQKFSFEVQKHQSLIEQESWVLEIDSLRAL